MSSFQIHIPDTTNAVPDVLVATLAVVGHNVTVGKGARKGEAESEANLCIESVCQTWDTVKMCVCIYIPDY